MVLFGGNDGQPEGREGGSVRTMTPTPLRIPALPATRPRRTAPRDREHVLQLFDRSALEFARVHGLQIKTWCGRWMMAAVGPKAPPTPRATQKARAGVRQLPPARGTARSGELRHPPACQACHCYGKMLPSRDQAVVKFGLAAALDGAAGAVLE